MIEYELVRFAHNWPPARRAYAPEGMLEYWNNGVMGPGIMQYWVNGNIRVDDKIKNG